MKSRLSLTLSGLFMAAQLLSQPPAQNNTLRGRILYQSSGNKPAVGVRVAEPDATAVFSLNNGDYQLKFQHKRNGAVLALEVGKDDGKGQQLELVNEKEVKAAKLPASAEEPLDIIVCPAGQRDIAAQRYYRILRTTADRELERKKKEVEDLLTQKEKDYQQISDLFALIDRMQAALDSAKIREQAFNIASINLDRASQMVKDAVKKIDEENDVEGALKILNAEALDTAYEHASAIKRQGEAIVKKADAEIQQVIEGYEFKISLLEPQFKYLEITECYKKIAWIYEMENYNKDDLIEIYSDLASFYNKYGDYQKSLKYYLYALEIRQVLTPLNQLGLARSYHDIAYTYGNLGKYQLQLEFNLKALDIREKLLSKDHIILATSYNNIAYNYGNLNNYGKQIEFNIKSLLIREKKLPADHSDLAFSYNNLSVAYGNIGEYGKSLYYILKAQPILEKKSLPNDPNLAGLYNNIAFAYKNFGHYEEAIYFQQKSLSIQENILPFNHPYLLITYSNMGAIYRDIGDYETGIELGQKAIRLGEDLTPKHNYLNRFYANLGITYVKARQYPDAKAALEKSESLKAEERVYRGWAMYYASQKKKKQAVESLQKATSLGLKDLKWLETEPDLKNIRKEKGYKELVERFKKG